jgi:hypothetical protein
MPLRLKGLDRQIESSSEFKMIVFDPGVIDRTGDHTSFPGAVFLTSRNRGRDRFLFVRLDTDVRTGKDPQCWQKEKTDPESWPEHGFSLSLPKY